MNMQYYIPNDKDSRLANIATHSKKIYKPLVEHFHTQTNIRQESVQSIDNSMSDSIANFNHNQLPQRQTINLQKQLTANHKKVAFLAGRE